MFSENSKSRRSTLALALLALFAVTHIGCRSNDRADTSSSTEAKSVGDHTITPEALAQILTTSANNPTAKPRLIHVGFAALYNTSHIPGSTYAGPGARDEGITKLKSEVAALPKDADIVLYCGCCPWENCPNVQPAFAALSQEGYTNVCVLKIGDHFQTDWIDKGYPVE